MNGVLHFSKATNRIPTRGMAINGRWDECSYDVPFSGKFDAEQMRSAVMKSKYLEGESVKSIEQIGIGLARVTMGYYNFAD